MGHAVRISLPFPSNDALGLGKLNTTTSASRAALNRSGRHRDGYGPRAWWTPNIGQESTDAVTTPMDREADAPNRHDIILRPEHLLARHKHGLQRSAKRC